MGRRGEEEGEGGDRKEEGERKVPQRLHYPQPPLDGVCQPRLLAAPQKPFPASKRARRSLLASNKTLSIDFFFNYNFFFRVIECR